MVRWGEIGARVTQRGQTTCCGACYLLPRPSPWRCTEVYLRSSPCVPLDVASPGRQNAESTSLDGKGKCTSKHQAAAALQLRQWKDSQANHWLEMCCPRHRADKDLNGRRGPIRPIRPLHSLSDKLPPPSRISCCRGKRNGESGCAFVERRHVRAKGQEPEPHSPHPYVPGSNSPAAFRVMAITRTRPHPRTHAKRHCPSPRTVTALCRFEMIGQYTIVAGALSLRGNVLYQEPEVFES